jgi:hypothetical protein
MSLAVSNTIYGIINDAMHDAGLLGLGDEPNSEQLAVTMRRLCDVINLYQTQGLKLFLLEDKEIPLVAGQATYTISPTGDVVMTKPSRILEAYILLTNGKVRRPIVPLSWDDYFRLSQVEGNNGAINSYFVDKQADSLNVTFWNTPDAEEAVNTAHVLLQVAAPNPINLTASMDFPQEWRIALRWGLADDICTGQPEAIMARCAGKAKIFRDALEDWDVEDAPTFLAMDSRYYQGGGRFK